MKKSFLVVDVSSVDIATQEHLFSLGVMPGHSLSLLHVCPFGGPLGFEVAGEKWAIRRQVWDKLEKVEHK